jgi:hypothetical protein
MNLLPEKHPSVANAHSRFVELQNAFVTVRFVTIRFLHQKALI